MQPLSGNQRPDLLTSLINMPLVLPLPRKMHLCISSSNVPRLATLLELLQSPQVCVLYILISKCASRHNCVHFFDISTCKGGPSMVCFVHFDFEMCFAPQRRALFRHLNFQKWSDPGVFVHFDFEISFVPQRRAIFRHLNFQKWSKPLEKHSVSRLSYLFAHLHLLSSYSFSSTLLSSSLL